MKICNKSLIFVLLLSSLAAQCADDDATTTQGATQQPAASVTFEVTFDYRDDSIPLNKTQVNANARIVKPNDPSKTGHTFDGWCIDSECSQPYDFDTSVTASLTLYAKWFDNDKKARLNNLVTFTQRDNGYSVTKKNDGITGPLELPTYWEGRPIIALDENAFLFCDSLTSVTIPPSVKSIGERAFSSCSSLTSVTIPPSVTSIGDRAFFDCTKLTSVTIPPSVTSIGERAFGECSKLTSVTIPPSVRSIGVDTFYSCVKLEEVTVQATTPPTLDSTAFRLCNKLRKINVPRGFEQVYKQALEWNTYNHKIFPFGGSTTPTLEEGITPTSTAVEITFDFRNGSSPVKIPVNEDRKVTRPSNPSKLGYQFDDWCTAVAGSQPYNFDTVITASLTLYAQWAIDKDAFNNILIFTQRDNGYSVTKKNNHITGSLEVPAYWEGKPIIALGDDAFRICHSLTSIIIPPSVTWIGDNAFQFCGSLTEVTVQATTPPGVAEQSGSGDMFSGCYKLRKINVPSRSEEVYRKAHKWSLYEANIVGQ